MLTSLLNILRVYNLRVIIHWTRFKENSEESIEDLKSALLKHRFVNIVTHIFLL